MRGRRLIALALTLAASPVAAQIPLANNGSGSASPRSWTVFGLALGEPLAIPLCKPKIRPDGTASAYLYEEDPAQTCYEPDIQLSDAPWRRGAVDFPLAKIPLIVHGSSGFTLIVDGKLEGLQFDTLGYGNTDAIIDELRKKFGPPTSVDHVTVSPHGIPLPAIHAEWQLAGLYVSYFNIKDSVDFGFLKIETPIMQSLEKSLNEAREKQRTAL